jgi:spoIIIJ-associated protein
VATADKSLEAEGETIDEAIANALAALAISRDQAEVQIVQDARRGVFGFGAQRARVRVSVRATVAPVEQAAPPSVRASTPADPPAPDDAVSALRRLLALMGFKARIDSVVGDRPEEICLRISSDARGLLIGRHGQTLDALEYLVNRIVGHKDEGAARIVLDAEGYRDRRRRELVDVARRLAARVRETGQAEAMDPLNARERRFVHLALAGDSTVSTRSAGEGAARYVVILPERAVRDGASARRHPGSRRPVD